MPSVWLYLSKALAVNIHIVYSIGAFGAFSHQL